MKVKHYYPRNFLHLLLFLYHFWAVGVRASNSDKIRLSSRKQALVDVDEEQAPVLEKGSGSIKAPKILRDSVDVEEVSEENERALAPRGVPFSGLKQLRVETGPSSPKTSPRRDKDDEQDGTAIIDTFFLDIIKEEGCSEYGRAEVEILGELVYHVRQKTSDVLEKLTERRYRAFSLQWQDIEDEIEVGERRQVELSFQAASYINDRKLELEKEKDDRGLKLQDLHDQMDNLRQVIRQEKEFLLNLYKAGSGLNENAINQGRVRLSQAQEELSRVEKHLLATQGKGESNALNRSIRSQIQAEQLWKDLMTSDSISQQHWLLGKKYIEQYLYLKCVQYFRMWTVEVEWHLDSFLTTQYRQLLPGLDETSTLTQRPVEGRPLLENSCAETFDALIRQLGRRLLNIQSLAESLTIIKHEYQDMIEEVQRMLETKIRDRLREIDDEQIEERLAHEGRLAQLRKHATVPGLKKTQRRDDMHPASEGEAKREEHERDDGGVEDKYRDEKKTESAQELKRVVAHFEELIESLERKVQAEEGRLRVLAIVGPRLRWALEILIDNLMPTGEDAPSHEAYQHQQHHQHDNSSDGDYYELAVNILTPPDR